MLKLVGTARNRSFRVLWLLEEMGLRYEHVAEGPRSDAVRAINPLGKVPVLIDEGEVIPDSVAIMTYLADRHGAFTAQAGTLARAKQDAMTNFLNDEFDACLWSAARHSFILPEDLRVPAIKDALRWEFARSQKELARRMGDGPFVMGDEMTIPDILATHCGTWARNAKFEITEPAYEAYLDRMIARPAWQRVNAMASAPA